MDAGVEAPSLAQSPAFRAALLLLALLVFTHDLRRSIGGSHAAWHQPSTPSPALPSPPPLGSNAACLASQLALGRAGRLLQASLSPRCATPRALGVAVPVYPPHFPYLLNYLAPLAAAAAEGEALGWDLFPVFSTDADAEAFAAFLATNGTLALYAPWYTPLVLSWDPLVAPRAAATEGWGFRAPIVLYKNYHALALLHACYVHLAVLDAELAVLRPRDLVGAFAQRAAQGRVLAGFVPRYRYFNLWSTCMFSPEDRAQLALLTRDNCLYSWWSDVPVFVAGDVPAFLAYIGYPARFGAPKGTEFAHLAYEQWKVVRGEWRAIDLSDAPVHYALCGSLEMMGSAEDYEAVRSAYPPGPRWLSAAFCAKHPAHCAGNAALVLLYHLNRDGELLDLAARQSCEAQHFNRDPFDPGEPARHRQGCVWANGTRSDVSPPIVQ